MTVRHRPDLIDQPTRRPTRKVTAATIGAASGAVLVGLGQATAATSPWLAWLATPQIAVILTAIGSAVGAGVAGYVMREWAA